MAAEGVRRIGIELRMMLQLRDSQSLEGVNIGWEPPSHCPALVVIRVLDQTESYTSNGASNCSGCISIC